MGEISFPGVLDLGWFNMDTYGILCLYTHWEVYNETRRAWVDPLTLINCKLQLGWCQ